MSRYKALEDAINIVAERRISLINNPAVYRFMWDITEYLQSQQSEAFNAEFREKL
jgi:hypothetical protein